jgi:hypothetical protein
MTADSYKFYLDHTNPNDKYIDELINSASALGTFEQHGMNAWIFKCRNSVGHILDVSHDNDSLFLVCFHNKPYQMFHTLDDAQKRMLALDLMLGGVA